MTIAARQDQPVFSLEMLWRDERYRSVIIQTITLMALMLAFAWLISNTVQNLSALGKDFNFSFLWQPAGYDINQKLIEYDNQDTNARAALVGILNTLGVAALIRGLNAIFDVPDRSGLRHLGVALLLTLGLVGMGIVAMLAVVVAPVVIALLPLGPTEAMALTAIRWIVALGVIVLGLGLLFRWGPNRGGDRPRLITPGSLLVAPLWLAASAALSAYVAGFGTYNEVYGSIGVVIVLLLWFWVSAYLVLLGAALDRRLHARR